MTELAGETASDRSSSAAGAPLSAGALMRRAREQAGMHIGALAVALKVPVKKLEALEADRHDLLPDAVFVRALAASVCKSLKTDPLPVLQLLPGYAAPRLALGNPDGHGSYSAPRDRWHVPLLSRLSKPVAAMVAVLLVATLVLWLWPTKADGPTARRTESKTEAPAEPTVTLVPVVAPTPLASASQVAGPASAAAVSAPSVPASAVRTAPDPAVAASGSVLSIKARSASWVEVVDAAGAVQLRRVLDSGELVVAGGAMPLSVVIGRTNATEVAVRGQVFDLAPHTRDNVARFQVK